MLQGRSDSIKLGTATLILTYSWVLNNCTFTITFWGANFPPVRSLLGVVRLFFLDHVSALKVYFALYNIYFEHFC